MPGPMTRTHYNHSLHEVMQLLKDDGRIFDYWSAVNFGAICWAESGGNAHATPVVVNPDSPAHLSLDVGLMQLNTFWQQARFSNVAAALDPATNVRLAVDLCLLPHSTNPDPKPWRPTWHWWAGYTSGNYKVHLPASARAWRDVTDGK